MRTRQYSISSSPLANPETCSISYSLITSASAHADKSHPFLGFAGSYLSSLHVGDSLQVCVRRPQSSNQFRLPLQADKTPIMMSCAGTGLGPFRGFVQQRAELIAAAASTTAAKGNAPALVLGPAILFIGCRSATRDQLYAEELDSWAKAGAVDLRYAFSQDTSDPRAQGCKYVQERMLKDKADVYAMWERGAKIYVCGSPGLAREVGAMARRLVRERLVDQRREVEEEKLQEWFLGQRGERFVSDVFA